MKRSVVLSLLLMLSTTSLSAEVSKTPLSDSIYLKTNSNIIEYKNIINERDGIYRDLVTINGNPALYAGGDFDLYYTLKIENNSLFLDCLYADLRNHKNGIRISNAVCNINTPLKPNYSDVGFAYTDQWQEAADKVDISPLATYGKAIDVIVSNIGEVEVHEKYQSIDDLEGSNPEIYMKYDEGCHSFKHSKVFLVYQSKEALEPQYIEVLRSSDPMSLERFDESSLKDLASEDCSLMVRISHDN